MYQQALCASIELIINKALALNNNKVSAIHKLEQQSLTLNLTELGFPICFSVNKEKVLVTSLIERSQCTIETSVKTLLTLKQEQKLTELIKQEKLDVIGDIKVAQHFASIAENIDIDWQSEIAKQLGDVATYKLSRLGKSLSEKIVFAGEQIQADVSEWLVHEKRLVVTADQLNVFNQQVTHIAEQTDDIFTRIEQLANKLAVKE